MSKVLANRAAIEKAVTKALREQPIVDMHTHLYPPVFGTPVPNKTGKVDPAGLLLWGLDELLTYHYLVASRSPYRIVPAYARKGASLPYGEFWKMSKTQQADHIWKHLFVERAPVSEACRGVLTCLEPIGTGGGGPKSWGKFSARRRFGAQDPRQIYRQGDGNRECREHHDDQSGV